MKARILMVIFIFTLYALSNAVQSAGVDENTVLYLKFDEGEGDVAEDLSIYGNDGKVVGAAWVEGKYSNALEFNGTAATYVVMPHTPVLDEIVKDVTLEAWVKFPAVQSDAKVICKHESGGYSLELRDGFTSSQPHINGAYILFRGKTLLEPDTWYYVANTYDGDTIKVYLDGELDGEQNAPGSITISAAPLMVGGNPNTAGVASGQYFAGVIDEARVSNVVRTPAEIKAAMSGKDLSVDSRGKLAITWSRIKAHH